MFYKMRFSFNKKLMKDQRSIHFQVIFSIFRHLLIAQIYLSKIDISDLQEINAAITNYNNQLITNQQAYVSLQNKIFQFKRSDAMASLLLEYQNTSQTQIQDRLKSIYYEFCRQLQLLTKIKEQIYEKQPEKIKLFIKVLKKQVEQETKKIDDQHMILQQLRRVKFTKRVKKALTELGFNMVYKLAPSLEHDIDKHYTNLVKLFELYFQSVNKEEQLRKIHVLKSASTIFRIQLYVDLLQLLLKNFSKLLLMRIQTAIQTLDARSKRHLVDQFISKNTQTKQKQRQIRSLRNVKKKHRPWLPSLKESLIIQKIKEPFNRLSTKKIDLTMIEIRELKPMCQSQMIAQIKQNKKLKFLTQMSMQLISNNNDASVFLGRSFKEFESEQIKMKSKQLRRRTRLQPLTFYERYRNISLKTVQQKQDFLLKFQNNFQQIQKNSIMTDLDGDWRIKFERKTRLTDSEWLIENHNSLLHILIHRNTQISKGINEYAVNYNRQLK